jgi:hypothetical protein
MFRLNNTDYAISGMTDCPTLPNDPTALGVDKDMQLWQPLGIQKK